MTEEHLTDGWEPDLRGWGPCSSPSGLAAFSLGVTLPEARRRGYWAAMAGVRLLDAPDLPAVGVFSDMSRPGAEALGFLPITRCTLWHRPRARTS